MKTHILICINECMDVVSVDAFPTAKAAEKEMKRQYRAEGRKGDEDAPALIEKKITLTTAFVNRGEDWMYSWEIKEVEVPEKARRTTRP